MAKKQIANLTEKTTPAVADLLLLADTEDSNKWKKSTLENLMIQAKGYKEYTFAIRQSGTDAPTIYVTKDDFKLETPLTAVRSGAGIYYIDISSLSVTTGEKLDLLLSNSNGYGYPAGTEVNTLAKAYFSNSNVLQIRTYNQAIDTGILTLSDSVLQSVSHPVKISIQQALEDT